MKKLIILVLTLITDANYNVSFSSPLNSGNNSSEIHAKKDVSSIQTSPEKTQGKEKSEEEEEPFIGALTLATNYVWRGISQTSNIPAVQGSLTYTFPKYGIYLNGWGSNVRFPVANGDTLLIDAAGENEEALSLLPPSELNYATLEIDSAIGITNTIHEHFTYDISLVRYFYPKAKIANYNELLTKWAFYFLTAEVDYSNDVYNSGESATYYNVGFNFDIPPRLVANLKDVSISGGVGHYNLPEEVGLADYNDYNLQISKKFKVWTIALQWTNTNHNSVDPEHLKGSHVIGTLSAEF